MATRFVTKGILFVIPVCISFYVLEYCIDSGLRKTKTGNFTEWNDIYNSRINADLIILGSSRAWVHISPRILDSVLLTNSYNLGIDGYNFEMQYYRFKIFLEHNRKPKYIIHSVDIMSMERRKDLFRNEQFLPYLNDPLIREATQGYEGEFNILQYYLPLKYVGKAKPIVIGLLEFFNIKHFNDGKYKGYLGTELLWDHEFDRFKEKHKNGIMQPVRKESVELFNEYLSYCHNNGMKVFLVYSPEYFEAQPLFLNRDSIISIYTDGSRNHGASFIDFSDDSIGRQKQLFFNSQHLTKEGAELFSLKLANRLKSAIR